MPTQRQNDEKNRLSKRRQELKREFSYLSENILSSNQQEYLEYLRELLASGGITSTKERKKRKQEIAELEEFINQQQEKINQETQAKFQREGLELPSNVGRTSKTDGNRRDVSQESTDTRIDQDMDRREREAGLFLAGNDPLSGRERLDNLPSTIEERERAAGLTDTTSGREGFDTKGQGGQEDTVKPNQEEEDQFGTIGVILCINGRPHRASILGQVGAKLES
tara:strand:+ start:3673 stop:4344 length:672 start_codon:yes stop_codon:yes gene_type:complete